jgi:hypothetical protein
MADLRTGSKQELACVLADDQDQLLNASERLLLGKGVRVLGKVRTGVGVLQLLEEQPITAVVASVASGVVYIDPQLRRDREEACS